MSWERFERPRKRHVGRSADEYTDDEIREMTLDLMRGLAEGHRAAQQMNDPEPDRVRSYCPPECRYNYEGPQRVEAAS